MFDFDDDNTWYPTISSKDVASLRYLNWSKMLLLIGQGVSASCINLSSWSQHCSQTKFKWRLRFQASGKAISFKVNTFVQQHSSEDFYYKVARFAGGFVPQLSDDDDELEYISRLIKLEGSRFLCDPKSNIMMQSLEASELRKRRCAEAHLVVSVWVTKVL